MIPPCCRFTDLTKLGEIINRQKDILEFNRKLKKDDYHAKPITSKVVIVIDDMVSDRSIRWNVDVTRLFTTGRHLSDATCLVDICLLTQYAKSLPPIVRQNTDVALVFRQDSHEQRKTLVSEYLTVSQSLKEGMQWFEKLNDIPFGALGIHVTRSNKKTLEDYVTLYVAPAKLTSFRIGAKQYWEKEKDLQYVK